MGEVLIAGSAALLICIFLSPKFIGFLREREFGQFIREEGPEGHHEKAGTPTMGGIIIFAAISIPFLILSDYDWRSVGVYGVAIACALLGFADDYTKIIKRRSLGLRARTKLVVTIGISIGLWWIATEQADLAETLRFRVIDYQVDLSFLGGVPYLLLIYLVVAGTASAASPPAAPRSSCSPTSASRSGPGRWTSPCSPPASSAPASASSGSTRS